MATGIKEKSSIFCSCYDSALDELFSPVPQGKEAAAFGPLLAQRKVPVSKPEQEGTIFLFCNIYFPAYCVVS